MFSQQLLITVQKPKRKPSCDGLYNFLKDSNSMHPNSNTVALQFRGTMVD